MAEPAVNPDVLAGLALAREKLQELVDTSSSSRARLGAKDGQHELGPHCECCGAGISDWVIKDAVRLYLQMWVLFPFDTALQAAKGAATEGERSYLRAVSLGVAAGQ
jgi:hypothetical protein